MDEALNDGANWLDSLTGAYVQVMQAKTDAILAQRNAQGQYYTEGKPVVSTTSGGLALSPAALLLVAGGLVFLLVKR